MVKLTLATFIMIVLFSFFWFAINYDITLFKSIKKLQKNLINDLKSRKKSKPDFGFNLLTLCLIITGMALVFLLVYTVSFFIVNYFFYSSNENNNSIVSAIYTSTATIISIFASALMIFYQIEQKKKQEKYSLLRSCRPTVTYYSFPSKDEDSIHIKFAFLNANLNDLDMKFKWPDAFIYKDLNNPNSHEINRISGDHLEICYDQVFIRFNSIANMDTPKAIFLLKLNTLMNERIIIIGSLGDPESYFYSDSRDNTVSDHGGDYATYTDFALIENWMNQQEQENTVFVQQVKKLRPFLQDLQNSGYGDELLLR
jgi:uncharacterized membrane protein